MLFLFKSDKNFLVTMKTYFKVTIGSFFPKWGYETCFDIERPNPIQYTSQRHVLVSRRLQGVWCKSSEAMS